MTELSERFGASRETGYKWIRCYVREEPRGWRVREKEDNRVLPMLSV